MMKTASLGLLEVMVVRVNAGGDAPPDPPLLVTSWAIPPFFVFFKKRFLANERDNIGVEGFMLMWCGPWPRESRADP